jgi:DNA modification methylase
MPPTYPPAHSQPPPLTVWAITARHDPTPAPGLLTLGLAKRIVTEFSPPEALIVDPYASGDGTVIAAAATSERLAIGITCDPARHRTARNRIDQHLPPERHALARLRIGEVDRLGVVLADVAGWVDLIVTSPPTNTTNSERPGDTEAAGIGCRFGEVLAQCLRVLKPGGLLITATRNTTTLDGRLQDVLARVTALARHAGFGYLQHIVAITTPSQDQPPTAPPGAHGWHIGPRTDIAVFTAPDERQVAPMADASDETGAR